MPAKHADFMAMFEIFVFERSHQFKLLVELEQFIAGRDPDMIIVKRDAAQTPVPAAPLPIDIHPVPIDRLEDFISVGVDQVNAAMALALIAAPHDRSCDK